MGRRPLYDPDVMKIGDTLTLPKSKKKFGHQYAKNFNDRLPGKKFKFVNGLIERIQ